MKKTNYYTLVFITLFFSSCIEKYTPQIYSKDDNNYVVEGEITNQEGFQTIYISKTSPVSSPKYIPATGCIVEIWDDKGNSFSLSEYRQGEYKVWINQQYLNPGTSYQLKIITPEDMELVSDFDKMPSCPKLDSVYYIKEPPPPTYKNDNYDDAEGVQFYADFTGKNDDSKFLKWELTETWEYHSDQLLFGYVDINGHHSISDPDYSFRVCWKTETIKEIFTLSTSFLDENAYRKYHLHYVDNHSARLKNGYYLVIKQLALSEDAYIYWEQLRVNSTEQGSLYEKQPLPVTGNIYNITDPGREVLGFFGASSVETKTIFVDNVNDINFDYNTFCSIYIPKYVPPYSIDTLYYTYIRGEKLYMTKPCWNCLSLGGTNIKPDFWPK